MEETAKVTSIKILIDSLTDSEFEMIRNYCETKAIQNHNRKELLHRLSQME